MFLILQIFTALILILAANTAYQDFPRLASILARDGFMPSHFRNRGDRLVFSNGIAVLAGLAVVLVWLFDADLTRLIQLYVVGVFVALTLSQAGMVRRWMAAAHRLGWRGQGGGQRRRGAHHRAGVPRSWSATRFVLGRVDGHRWRCRSWSDCSCSWATTIARSGRCSTSSVPARSGLET